MVPVTEGREAARRQARAPLRQRSRRRWALIGGVAACWVVLELVMGSAVSATVLLVAIAGLGAASVGGLRALGVTRDHPWIRQLASRPWRDGQDVLNVAMRHLSDVFVVTPSGLLFAPNVVELQLNPGDLVSLCERMELGVISASVTEVYEEQVAARGARFAGPGRADVHVVAAGSVPPGRYRLRQGDPVSVDAQPDLPDAWYADVAPELVHAGPQHADAGPSRSTWQQPDSGLTVAGGMVTLLEGSLASAPVLRLVTGSSVAETMTSGARAGRGSVELVLPDVPTVSREHARFTFADGRWWVTNQGRNGLTLNGTPVTGEQQLSDGDAIRWGTRSDALLSRVEIGRGPEVRLLSSRRSETGWPRRWARRRSGVAAKWRRLGFSFGQKRAASG
jgi:pSer/pThr/pTyr-binding forkhead associated (FHA) protein